MDSVPVHGFAFNEAISLVLYCDSQTENDQYWRVGHKPHTVSQRGREMGHARQSVQHES